MKRFTALILFIAILFISMTLLGIYIKNKLTKDTVNIISVEIQLYKYKYGKDEIDNHPYKTILLNTNSEIKEFSNIINKLSEVSDSKTLKSNNCIIRINYEKSTSNDLNTDVYDVWYDETNQTQLIFRKGEKYYELPLESSKTIYKMVNAK